MPFKHIDSILHMASRINAIVFLDVQIGFSSVQRMDEAISARGKVLSDEEEKYLEELYKAKSISGHQ